MSQTKVTRIVTSGAFPGRAVAQEYAANHVDYCQAPCPFEVATPRAWIRTIASWPSALLSFFYYGSALPATLSTRLAQANAKTGEIFLVGAYHWIDNFPIPGFGWILPPIPLWARVAIIGLAGSYAVLRVYRFWLLPLFWLGMFCLVYTSLRSCFYHWYAVPIILAIRPVAKFSQEGYPSPLIVYSRTTK